MTVNRIFSLFFIFPFLFSSMARADNSSATTSDIENFLPRQCYFSGRFVQIRTVDGIPAPLESQGNFLFSCKHGLIWHTAHPTRETVIYSNGKSHFHVDANGRIQPLKGRLHGNMALLLNGLMGADVSYLEKYFSFGAIEPDNVELHPKKKNMRKFIERLNLRKSEESIEISLLNDALNSTIIRIFDSRILSRFDSNQCRGHYPEPAEVCDSLLRDPDK